MILLFVLRKPGSLIKVVVLSFVATQISLQNELHHVFTKQVVLRGSGRRSSPTAAQTLRQQHNFVHLAPLLIDATEMEGYDFDQMQSPYQIRTGDELPRWAYRYPVLGAPNKTAGDKSICFVHVGKTAGSTLACYLGFRYECGEKMHLPQGQLLLQTSHLIHNSFNDCRDDDNYYLFALRDPVSRMKSWFTYERPGPQEQDGVLYRRKKALFIDCPFETFSDLVEKGLGDPLEHKRRFTRLSPTCT